MRLVLSQGNTHLQRSRQRGAVAVIVGLTMVVMIGAVGLAMDAGRLYISKTETQNAADACALSASLDLTGAPNIPAAQFAIAENAGRAVARRNRTNLQRTAVTNAEITVQFGSALTGPWVGAAAASPDARYVRCTIAEPAVASTFMRLLGFTTSAVNSLASATLAPSQTNCAAMPVGLCATSGTAPYGFVVGQWYTSLFGTGGQLTGSFGWLDFSPPAGGANELSAQILGAGACTVATGSQVGQTGAVQSLANDWNSRFGIYQGGPSVDAGVPDRSGYSYTPTNWPSQQNALGNFTGTRRPANAPYGTSVANGNTITGLRIANGARVAQAAELADRGAPRRIVPLPVINCAAFASSQTVPVIDWGCALLLHPISTRGGPGGGGPETLRVEYLGLVTDSGSPCATVGGVGNGASTGPLVPALVQ
jgi:Flp pilus assembly protein TadG